MPTAKPSTNPNLQAALSLAADGFKVFPCGSDKRPLVKAWQDAATSDRSRVRQWWQQFPDAVPALPAGPNGLAVVDLDRRDGKDGVASYRALGLDPDRADLIVATPSGGLHLYFAAEGARQTGGSIGPGIDTRAGNGYVIAPGAVTAAGRYSVTKGDPATVLFLGLSAWPETLRDARAPASDAAQPEAGQYSVANLRGPLAVIPNDGPYDQWVAVLMALHHATGGSADGLALAQGWSAGYPGFDPKEVTSKWRSFGKAEGLLVTAETLFAEARKCGWQAVGADAFEDESTLETEADVDAFLNGESPAQKPKPGGSRLTFLSPGDCVDLPAREYLVKHLIAPGQVGCIFGEPGAGKSVIAPYLAYAVAQGAEAFGLRTRQGGAWYVACEDETGMAGRVAALHHDLGEAPGFRLVTGCSDLFSPGQVQGKGSPDLEELRKAVKRDRPGLVIVDTLAMAMPGLEENDAAGMARVVAIGRALARHGAAVIFVHHGTKAEGNTPRGHSVFNGALDFSIQVNRADAAGIVRGQVRKNRNGPADLDIAFRIVSREVGVDVDGDPVTAPVCQPLDPLEAGEAGPGLFPSERAALAVWHEVADGRATVHETDWRAACVEGRAVSAADSPDSRRKAFKRAAEGLVRKGVLTFGAGGYVRAEAAHLVEAFDDEE